MKRLSRCILALAAISLLAGANAAYSTSFTFTSFDYPGATETLAGGINNSGKIVGSYNDATGNTYGFLKVGDTYTQIAYPGAYSTFAFGINDSGAIVGGYNNPGINQPVYGFLKVGDTYTQIAYPGAADYTVANGINNSGKIVGSYRDASGIQGFLKVGDTYTQIAYPPPGSTQNFANGINASGAIVGQYSVIGSIDIHGFLKVGDTYTDITYPGLTGFGKLTQAWGINNSDEIVGIYQVAGTPYYSFLKVGDTYTQIAYPGAADTFAHGINDPGVIVGYYDDGLNIHSFIATPVPLPSTLLFLSSGLLGLAGWRYRGRKS